MTNDLPPDSDDQINIGDRQKALDPVNPEESPIVESEFRREQDRRKLEHTQWLEKAPIWERRIKLAAEMTPSAIAALVIIVVTIGSLSIAFGVGSPTSEEKERATSRLELVLTGTLAFLFGKSLNSKDNN